jgi:cytochrome b561
LIESNSNPYDPLSRALHWITAVAATIAFILGPSGYGRLLRNGVDPGTRNDIVWHESLGVLVFTLTVLRLIWVALRPRAPRFPMAAWMYRLSRLMHLVLWCLLFLLPMTALLALGTESHPLTLLGGIRVNELPFIKNSFFTGLADWGDVHKFLGDTLMWLAGLHALAALYHHVILKDGVLRAMLPWRMRP